MLHGQTIEQSFLKASHLYFSAVRSQWTSECTLLQ